MVSLVVDRVLEFFNEKLLTLIPEAEMVWAYTANMVFNFLITALLFGIIFKVLPDARIRWKEVGVGACFTALLFLFGNMGMGYYLTQGVLDGFWWVAGSLVFILFWGYYFAVIM